METPITFPRDIINLIIKHFDMDTRIKVGIFFKLKIPKTLQEKLSKIIKPKSIKYNCKNITETSINLGSKRIVFDNSNAHLNRTVLGLMHPQYYLVKKFDKHMNLIEYKILNAEIKTKIRYCAVIKVSNINI